MIKSSYYYFRFREFFVYFEGQTSTKYVFCKYFISSLWLAFSFSIHAFPWVLFNFSKSSLSIFCLKDLDFGVVYKNSSSNQNSNIFSSRSFVVSYFTLVLWSILSKCLWCGVCVYTHLLFIWATQIFSAICCKDYALSWEMPCTSVKNHFPVLIWTNFWGPLSVTYSLMLSWLL